MATGFTIGKLAEAAGVHVETIRYYERRGLLQQPTRRPGSGYREYSSDDLWRLGFIARGKALGFTLTEIGDLLGAGGADADAVVAAARRKLDEVDRQRAALDDVRTRLLALTDRCAGAEPDTADCVSLVLG
jgi:DNA-binding transcriptional MerR regulator